MSATMQPPLSKSKLLSAHQCLKMLHLEWHQPELAEVSEATQAAFRTGHQVGAVAKKIYGTADSVEIAYQPGDMDAMVRETADLLANGADFPIFEATFRHEGVLVRVDVLLPEGNGWRAVEIKASTTVKPEHKIDCAIQWWVMHGVGLPIESIALGHVNNQFVYREDGDYEGLIAEEDLTEEAQALAATVPELVRKARGAVNGGVPHVAVGKQCNKPYECKFFAQCWPQDAEYPVTGLGGSKAKHAEWVNRGIRDMRDIPVEEVTAETQIRIYRVTCQGEPEVLPGARAILSSMAYPRYYLDFETIGPAIPIWTGTRPYELIPVQWSIHIDDGQGDGTLASMRHEEFLDLSGEPPMRALAERMIECLGESGPVLMYTSYEKRVINALIEMFPDLEQPLQAIIDRLFDLAVVVKDHYYHPSMLGSWSIKAAAPAMAPHMNYAALEGIDVGTAASEGFVEAIDPETTAERKAELEEQLLRYCEFDTEAMMEISSLLLRDSHESS